MKKIATLFFIIIYILMHLPNVFAVKLFLVFLLLALGFSLFFQQVNLSKYFATGMATCFFTLAYFCFFIGKPCAPNLENKEISLTGKIVSLPVEQNHATHFWVKSLNPKARILLHYYGSALTFKPGETWRFIVKLKSSHGQLNPGEFDEEQWLLVQKIRMMGSIHHGKKISDSRFNLDRLRWHLKNKIEPLLENNPAKAIILALLLGVREDIDADTWEIFRNTGTNHLVAIAGLHIGFIAFFVFQATMLFLRLFPKLLLRIPAQTIAWVLSALAGSAYALLVGFSVATQRACVMLICFAGAKCFRRHVLAWDVYAVALFFVLLLNPLNVLDMGFYMSFFAVGMLIYFYEKSDLSLSGWKKHAKTQFFLSVAMIPVTLYFFMEIPGLAFFANSIAIPLMGFLVLPLLVLSLLLLWLNLSVTKFLLALAGFILSFTLKILAWFSAQDFFIYYDSLHHIWQLWLLILVIVLFFSPFKKISVLSAALFLMSMIPSYFPLKKGELQMDLLDVGQGLSVFIQTQHHSLLYDTGPRLGNMDSGTNVIIPFLRYEHIHTLDVLMISHADNDHIGGAQSVLKTFPVNQIMTSVPEKFPKNKKVSQCLAGDSWEWDGVIFTTLYPDRDHYGLDNDSSCVLKITAGKNSILLTGDIEKIGEHELLDQQKAALASTLIVAPHHGSKTSSSVDFLQAVSPHYVFYPVGYLNRFHFPSPLTLEHYHAIGAIPFSTAVSGMIEADFHVNDSVSIIPYRENHQYFWRNY